MNSAYFFVYVLIILEVLSDDISTDNQWIDYKTKYNKVYTNRIDEYQHYQNFKRTDDVIKRHNEMFSKGESMYEMDHNQFSDMSSDDYSQMFEQSSAPKDHDLSIKIRNLLVMYESVKKDPPKTLTYQEYCLEPLRQGNCGSCWAFAASALVEAKLKMKNKRYDTHLSPQYLLDCVDGGTCSGGNVNEAFRYLKNNGLVSLKDYPYAERKKTCSANKPKMYQKITDNGYYHLDGDEEKLKEILAIDGPVVVKVQASDSFMRYKKGIFTDNTSRNSCYYSRGHAVLLVGYDYEWGLFSNTDYWIVKNSWGKDWGESGYIRIRRNYDNNCKIACGAYFAIAGSSKASDSSRILLVVMLFGFVFRFLNI